MRFISILLLFFSINLTAQNAQKVYADTRFKSRVVYAQTRPNIFTDFAWTEPDYHQTAVTFLNHVYYFTFNGASFLLTQLDENMMRLEGGGTSSTVEKEVSQKNIYYDKSLLKNTQSTQNKWIAYAQKENTSDSSKYHLQWKWEQTNASVLVIPEYEIWTFEISEKRIIYIYRIKQANGEFSYFIQNASYLIASEYDGTKLLLLDINCNGIYTDSADQILFHSWNPFDKSKAYKKVNMFVENFWYDISYLNKLLFVDVAYENGKLSLTNTNTLFNNNPNISGSVSFKKVPKGARILINNEEVLSKKGKNIYNYGFGNYHAQVFANGFAANEFTFCVNEKNSNPTFRFQKSEAKAVIELKHLISDDFVVQLKNTNGETQHFYNQKIIETLPGNYEMIMNVGGLQLSEKFELKKNETHVYDFENALIKSK